MAMPLSSALSSVLPLPASLRARRSQLTPMGGPGSSEMPSGPSSMFDSAGALGVTVEVPESEQGALALHAHLASSPEVEAMLVIDPSGVWAHGMMQALSDATGSPIDRLRVHSRGGLQIRAVVDETLLPAGNGPHRLVRCLHGDTKLTDRRAVFGALLSHSQVCGVLVGPMPSADAATLVQEMHRAAQQPAAAQVRWVFYLGADHRGLDEKIAALAWPSAPAAPAILHARPLNRSVTTVWNSLYEAWVGP
jgi:hypothetical protein